MRYRALATDYDGTIAREGIVEDFTIASLKALKESGRHLVLVTGREVDDLLRVFPHVGIFDIIVAENGALLYNPDTKKIRLLAEKPPEILIRTLREKGVTPLSVGHVIVATRSPYENIVLEVLQDLKLEHQIIFNKGAVMILPFWVNKGSGLREALEELGLSPRSVIGIGDAENDLDFLRICECSVAVANAVPQLKAEVDLVTLGDHGAGVRELIEKILTDGVFIPRRSGKDHFTN